MTQDTITKIDNFFRSITEATEYASHGIEAFSELAQRPGIRKHLSTRQLNLLTSLTALAIDVHIVTCDLQLVWNSMKGSRP